MGEGRGERQEAAPAEENEGVQHAQSKVLREDVRVGGHEGLGDGMGGLSASASLGEQGE